MWDGSDVALWFFLWRGFRFCGQCLIFGRRWRVGEMMFHDEDFWEVFLGIHDCFITGRKGSGKTLLAFAMGHKALRMGYIKGIYSNISHSFRRSRTVAYSMVVYDEPWQGIDARYSVQNYSMIGAYSRKTFTLWVYPSVYAIDKRCRGLEVQRAFQLAALPVSAWIYKWASADGDKGWFGLTEPEKYFGTYATHEIPYNDGGALDNLLSLIPEGVETIHGGKRGAHMVRAGVASDKLPGVEKRIDELEELVHELSTRVAGLESGAATGAETGSFGWGV